MGNGPDEIAIRDWLAAHIEMLPRLVTNTAKIKAALDAVETEFQRPHECGPGPDLLLRRIIARRMHAALDCLTEPIELIGTEVPLLSTPGVVGKKPSADLLAQQAELGCLLLVEVKRDVGPERQAVTELAAYSSGLQGRFLGLAPMDHVWVPIAVDWRQTVRAAFANETVWARRAVLPMKATVTASGASVTNLSLELLDLTSDLDEAAALSQFAWDCFDCTHFALAAEPGDARSLLGFIGTTAARLGLSGFAIFTKSNVGDFFPYPFGVIIAVHNPFRGALKQRQLITVRSEKDSGVVGMRKFVKKPLWDGFDIDLETNEDAWRQPLGVEPVDAEDEAGTSGQPSIDPSHSLEQIALASQNRHRTLIAEVQNRFKLMTGRTEMSSPSLKGLMDDGDFHLQNAFEQVGTFGLFQEAFEDRVLWECSHTTKHGDGPVMGGLGKDAFAAVARWEILIDFLELMNFEHDCQVEYVDDPEADEVDDEDP